jgi:MoaA/NifB/PqqE/SkfB family radical SAM enzyme
MRGSEERKRPEKPGLIYGSDQFEVRVTLACNVQCLFCNSWGQAENLVRDREEAFELAAKARALGARKLVVTGGEPLLVPWAPELLAWGRTAGFSMIVLQTNGILLAEEAVMARLEQAPPDEVLISLHGSNPEVAGLVTGHPHLFFKQVAGLRAALARLPRVMVNFVLCRQNLGDVEPMIDFLAGLSPRPALCAFSCVAPFGLAWANNSETIPTFEEAAPALLAALRRARNAGLAVVHSEYCGIPTCVAPGLREFAEPWDLSRPLHVPPDKTLLAHCGECAWRPRCTGVFRRYLELYGAPERSPAQA